MPAANLRAAVGAVTFLTRVPLARVIVVDGGDVARGTVFFPLVGAGIGAVTGLSAIFLHERLSSFLAAGLAVAISVVLTGALHLDALADTADAAGAPTRERALEIMRDSRIGSFGAAALMTDLLIRAAAIAGLAAAPVGALVAAGALSRAASLPLAAALPYARAEGGPGGVLSGRVRWASALAGVAIGLAVAVAVTGKGGGWGARGGAGGGPASR